MRITGGFLKNTRVKVVVKGVRPTSAKIREALFSMIGQDLNGKRFLDAFGGTGIMGMEAYSRGAEVEIAENNVQAYRQIVAQFSKYKDRVLIHHQNVQRILPLRTWDIIFMDPPYSFDPLPWLNRAASQATERLIFEHNSGVSLPLDLPGLSLQKSKRYGDSTLAIYECISD